MIPFPSLLPPSTAQPEYKSGTGPSLLAERRGIVRSPSPESPPLASHVPSASADHTAEGEEAKQWQKENHRTALEPDQRTNHEKHQKRTTRYLDITTQSLPLCYAQLEEKIRVQQEESMIKGAQKPPAPRPKPPPTTPPIPGRDAPLPRPAPLPPSVPKK